MSARTDELAVMVDTFQATQADPPGDHARRPVLSPELDGLIE